MPALPLVLWLIALVCCVTVIVMVLKTDTRRSHAGHPTDSASATSVASAASAAKTASDGVVASGDTVAAGEGESTDPRPVSKTVIILHFVSLILAMAPYIVATEAADSIGKTMLSWYDSVEGISGAILIVLIALELWFMYRQASRAAKAEAARAKLAGHKNLEHANQSAQTGKDNTGKHDDDAVSAANSGNDRK
ncbi:hypothetical protein CQR47_0949 [Bifidobacterium thermophilum]|uniref:Uncharacterized protein n=2 Tax=Bifidobacterium thermophilum TaxID=33905 RepID=M4RCU2_9BIFI|nr:lipase chaperone [Bifidobacterium thermophilum]AGH41300.1 hypothetical protein D805_1033 [Bifidobacterium thermophilum RBL67]MDW8486018.1 lipase chaperone [Bifidobacterium thermophilum]PKU90087.1 hypothetical protein CQR48_0941 [Bifidobacterium thermophilum]PKU92353.1 hypothetical protein CQR47_0949 [Bifidobacterium thermophilum]